MHHIRDVRLTINLDEDLHRMAKALAIAENCSISAAVNQLLRRINTAPNGFMRDGHRPPRLER